MRTLSFAFALVIANLAMAVPPDCPFDVPLTDSDIPCLCEGEVAEALPGEGDLLCVKGEGFVQEETSVTSPGQPDELQVCDAETPCPEGVGCYAFDGMETPVCWEGDPCDWCSGGDCTVLESYPAQVVCNDEPNEGEGEEGEGEGEGEDEPKTKCENPAGWCEVGATSGECNCYVGGGTAWASGASEGGGDTSASAPTEEECAATLIENCGEEAPDLATVCENDELEFCVNTYDKMVSACGEADDMKAMSPEVKEKLLAGEWDADFGPAIYNCCEAGDEEKKQMEDTLACIDSGKSCDECIETYEDVGVGEGGGEEATSEDTQKGGDDTDDRAESNSADGSEGEGEGEAVTDLGDDDDDDGGWFCSVAPNAEHSVSVVPGLFVLAMALAFVVARKK